MSKNKGQVLLAVILVFGFVAMGALLLSIKGEVKNGDTGLVAGGGLLPVISDIATSGVITIGATSLGVVATNTARCYLEIGNNGTHPVWLSYANNDVAAVVNSDMVIYASSSKIFSTANGNLNRDAINAISNGAAVLSVFEGSCR